MTWNSSVGLQFRDTECKNEIKIPGSGKWLLTIFSTAKASQNSISQKINTVFSNR